MKKLRLMKNVAMHVFLSDCIKRWRSLWTETKVLSSVSWLDYHLWLSFLPLIFFFFLAIGKKCWIVNFNSVILQFLLFKLGTPNCTPYFMQSREVKLSLVFNPPNGSKMSSLFRREQVRLSRADGRRQSAAALPGAHAAQLELDFRAHVSSASLRSFPYRTLWSIWDIVQN